MPRFDADYVPSAAMTVFAHPDDAEFGTAGTLAKWSRAGCRVTMVLCTSGNVGTQDAALTMSAVAELREGEQRRAAEILGVARLVFLGRDDCQLVPDLELRKEVVRAIRLHKPDVVFCADPSSWFEGAHYINHPDHRAAAAAALAAVFPCAQMPLLWPEVGPPHAVGAVYVTSGDAANTWIDVTDTLSQKAAALKAHASQMADWDPTDMVTRWAVANAAEGRKRVAAERRRAARAKGSDARAHKPPSVPPGVRHAESFRVIVLAREDAPAES